MLEHVVVTMVAYTETDAYTPRSHDLLMRLRAGLMRGSTA
jgi:hypothetical protein